MLNKKDRIFNNLYGLKGNGLKQPLNWGTGLNQKKLSLKVKIGFLNK